MLGPLPVRGNLYPFTAFLVVKEPAEAMPSPTANRFPLDDVVEEITLLSATLARVGHIAAAEKITIARKIGYAVGLELATKSPDKPTDLQASLARLFRRLSLGDVIVQEWEPVVFVRHSPPLNKNRANSTVGNLQAAIGDGVLEGLVQGRKQHRIFVRRSIPMEISQNSMGSRKRESDVNRL